MSWTISNTISAAKSDTPQDETSEEDERREDRPAQRG
jgi:hypothetical protein